MRLKIAGFMAILILTQLSVGGQHFVTADAITYFPDQRWVSTSPEDQGLSSTVINEMEQFLNDTDVPIRGLVITRNGYIVEEQYWAYNTENSSRHIFSCTKSFIGALIGIALKQGYLDNVSQKVLDFFPNMTIDNMDARKEAMAIEHLLTMTTGLDWNEWNISYQHPDNMYNQMFSFGVNAVQFFLSLPTVHDPGEQWVYTTGASHVLSAIIQEATHMTTYEFAEEYLFTPLNMTIGSWGLDNQGIYNGGTLLYVTPRAMAKLGLLYLNNGTWDGVEIISEDYVAQSHYPHTEAVFLATYYGYQWWVDPEEGIFSAIGSQGQYIHVIPDYNIVISITANADEPGEDASDAILEYVLSAVLQEGMGPADLIPIFGVTAGVLVVTVVILLYMKRK